MAPRSSVRRFTAFTVSATDTSTVFSLVSCVAAVHGVRAAMRSLKKTGTDFSSAQGMDPKKFFEVMGLNEVIELDARAGGKAFEVV